MKKTLLCCLLVMSVSGAQAQDSDYEPSMSEEVPVSGDPSQLEKPLGRVKSTTELNSESSSFIGDPDNIDPLNPRNESLREDDEPVLEEITQILDSPAAGASADGSEAAADAKKEKADRSPDDPDMALEKKFNDIYKRYNSNPTPEDIWQAASAKQTERQYVVQKGDTLWSISKILFGDANFWPKLWSLNKQGILNPHIIRPNTIIYFYAGDSDSSPTLSVGQPGQNGSVGDVNAVPGAPAAVNAGPAVPAGVIPDSLPLTRNTDYFENQRRELKIQLDSLPALPYVYSNDIYVTDKTVPTAVEIQISEVAKFRCYNGRLIKGIRYMGELEGEFELFEPLENFDSAVGVLHAYRRFGSAVPYEGRYLKATDCRGLLATNLVILPKDKIEDYRTQKISSTSAPKLIGGPDVVSQRLFILHQKAYVDFGSYPYEPGQEYSVRSKVTDEINGQIRIIEKYGSFAVVIITAMDDVMEIGDTIIVVQ